jgi:radical SAM superfamily enzyme YgiQ (UPF0313 family)
MQKPASIPINASRRDPSSQRDPASRSDSQNDSCGATTRGKVVLISPYELGRQPFALASPAAWLKRDGFEVVALDLSLQRLEPDAFAGAGMVGLYVGMHTATRIAQEAIPRIRELAPGARLVVFGLYAPMNSALFCRLGVDQVIGGEFEPRLAALARRFRDAPESGAPGAGAERSAATHIDIDKVDFILPDRSGLPPLERYAHLKLPDGGRKVVAFAEASRGCKHLCRHCPVVPVYQGRFRIVPVDIVIGDVRQQVAAGASHVSFGDPDFLNGPTHALRVVRALAAEFPGVTYDFTAKVQHLLAHASLLPEFSRTGCLFITSAVESVDDTVLATLDKNHVSGDFNRVAALLREAGIGFSPTFVAFTPWTSLAGYIELLRQVSELGMLEDVAPVQYSIRLLVPEGSYLLNLPGLRAMLEPFDGAMLGYPWRHPDPAMDALQKSVQGWVEASESGDMPRHEIFAGIWQRAHAAAGIAPPAIQGTAQGAAGARMSEPWYCCAEPTSSQLASF